VSAVVNDIGNQVMRSRPQGHVVCIPFVLAGSGCLW